MILVLIVIIGYLCGSIPTSIWLSKGLYGMDIRTQGSGNAGATNVYRVLGWKPALCAVVVDVGKGAVATYLPLLLMDPTADITSWAQIMGGTAAVAGHCWTVLAGFRGGKGVATGAGMLLVLYPLAVPICIAVFALIVWRTRYVSLASICATAALPITLSVHTFFLGKPLSWPLLAISLGLLPFVLYTHRTNIARLIAGTETKIGKKQG